MIKSQLERNQFDLALQSAREAQIRSLQYQGYIEAVLRRTERDVGRVDWRHEVPLRGRCMARPRAGLLRSIPRRDGRVGWTEGGLSVLRSSPGARSSGTALKWDASLLPAGQVVEPGLRLLANPHLLLDLVERAEEEHAGSHAHVCVDAGLRLVQVVPVPVKPAESLRWQAEVEKLVLPAGAISRSCAPFTCWRFGAPVLITALWPV